MSTPSSAMFNSSGVNVGDIISIDEACEKVGIAGNRADTKSLRGALLAALGSPEN